MAAAVVDQIIAASTVSRRERVVFCLGPFARRVNFSAQQNRALNLVWALFTRGHFRSGDQVAVIGGGIAGLTAAAGLIAYGCNVDVFETSETTVAKQRHTEHRLVHPTINQWPAARMSITTKLPFLEWSAGKCSDVTTSIADQFETLRGTNRLITEHRVVDISDIATGLVRLKVAPRLDDDRAYRLVIIAIGFGEERAAAPFEPISYWFPDGLEILRDTKKVEDFLVSGCGDGGLIDALRILHKDFAKGQLAFDLALELSDTQIATTIASAESAARLAGAADGLSEIYGKLANLLETDPEYEEIVKPLRRSLDKASLIYLIDRDLDHPYSLNAAPIHKLMIAHARERGFISYRCAAAELVDDQVLFAGRRIPAPPKSHVIIRHGPQIDFGRLLSDDEVESLRERQAAYSDFLAEALWPEPYPAAKPWPLRDLQNLDFIHSRVPLATKAVRSITEDVDIMPLVGRLRAIYGGAVPANAPEELFGIPVENIVRPKVRGIGG